VVGDKVEQVKPTQEPKFEVAKKNQPGYLDTYLDGLYEQAKTAQNELNAITTRIADVTGGKAGARQEPKSRDRTKQKVAADYKGDASQLVDLAGSKIEYQTLDALYKGLEAAEKAFAGKIVYIKDRFVKVADSGYRDILLNVKMSNGHVAEFRLHLESIDKFAGIEHATYEIRRSVQAIAEIGARGLAPEETALIKALNEVTIPIFEDALKKSLAPVP
jgi:hypothetical protein